MRKFVVVLRTQPLANGLKIISNFSHFYAHKILLGTTFTDIKIRLFKHAEVSILEDFIYTKYFLRTH